MEKTCAAYDEKTISEFVDNELSSEMNREIANHIETCPLCKKVAENYLQLSNTFIQDTTRETEKINKNLLRQNVLEKINREEKIFLKKVFAYFSPKFYLKVASVVAILIVSLVYFQSQPINPVGPSAIINSVNGENVSSIMIFETEKTKHTIIWFSEA